MKDFVMNSTAAANQEMSLPAGFVDRRRKENGSGVPDERRQFGNSYNELTAEGRELALAIDAYKINNRRRYITPDEMLQIVRTLGYSRP